MFLFGRSLKRTPRCIELDGQVQRAKATLAQLKAQRDAIARGASAARPARRPHQAELSRNRCGDQYSRDIRTRRQAAQARSSPSSPRKKTQATIGVRRSRAGSAAAAARPTGRFACVNATASIFRSARPRTRPSRGASARQCRTRPLRRKRRPASPRPPVRSHRPQPDRGRRAWKTRRPPHPPRSSSGTSVIDPAGAHFTVALSREKTPGVTPNPPDCFAAGPVASL